MQLIRQNLLSLAIALIAVSGNSYAACVWDVGPTPVQRLAEAGIKPTFDDISVVVLDESQDPEFRSLAATALGQLADERAIPMLIESLSDQNLDVRLGAASGLRCLPANESVQPLCQMALHDVNPIARQVATVSLSSIMSEDATKCLIRVATNEQGPRQSRLESLELLNQQFERRDGFEELIPGLQNSDPDIRGMAGVVLSREYEHEPEVLESLLVIEAMVTAAVSMNIDSWLYRRVVKRLEEIAGQKFIGELEADREVSNLEVRAGINARILEWADNDPTLSLAHQ